MKSFSPVVARRFSCLTRGKNDRDGGAINNPFPYARLCHQVTIARDITFSQLPCLFFSLPPSLGIRSRSIPFHDCDKDDSSKKRGEGEKEKTVPSAQSIRPSE